MRQLPQIKVGDAFRELDGGVQVDLGHMCGPPTKFKFVKCFFLHRFWCPPWEEAHLWTQLYIWATHRVKCVSMGLQLQLSKWATVRNESVHNLTFHFCTWGKMIWDSSRAKLQ